MLFPCTYLPVENPIVKPAQLKKKKKSEKEKQVTQDYQTDREDEFQFGIATFAPELTRTDPEDEFVPVSVENEAQQSVEEAVQEGAKRISSRESSGDWYHGSSGG
jgi:membrane carboxypeptidase/penicillin-binding protein PbpC